jgi:hypothetical protein
MLQRRLYYGHTSKNIYKMMCKMLGYIRRINEMEAKTILSYLHSQLYDSLIAILTDLTDQQLEYHAPQIDTRSIRDVAIHAYRPVFAIACVLAREKWPVRPQLPVTKNELFNLLQTMHTQTDAYLIRIPLDTLDEAIPLPWNQNQSGLEALVGSFMHGIQHIGAIQGIRAFGGFPTPPEDPKPARG